MRVPVPAVGNRALGFGRRCARCSPRPEDSGAGSTKTAHVLDALPKSAQPAEEDALADIYNAEDKNHAATAVRVFAEQYAATFPNAVAKVIDGQDVLSAFFDYPAVRHEALFGRAEGCRLRPGRYGSVCSARPPVAGWWSSPKPLLWGR